MDVENIDVSTQKEDNENEMEKESKENQGNSPVPEIKVSRDEPTDTIKEEVTDEETNKDKIEGNREDLPQDNEPNDDKLRNDVGSNAISNADFSAETNDRNLELDQTNEPHLAENTPQVCLINIESVTNDTAHVADVKRIEQENLSTANEKVRLDNDNKFHNL